MVSVEDTQRKYIQLEVRSFMINTQIETAARLAIRDNPKKRVLPLSVEGKTYYIKRLLSNGRNKLVKQGAHAAYLTEVYKIMEVNERLPLAPHIVLLTDDFFVMEACGKPLQRIVKEHDATAEEAYYQAGIALSSLHQLGLHHGRPALRDISWDAEKHRITFLDWESEKTFFHVDARTLDLFLFIHSYFREGWDTTVYLDQAMAGYQTVAGSDERLAEVLRFIDQHTLIFHICRSASSFGWIDVVSVSKAEDYLRTLIKNNSAS